MLRLGEHYDAVLLRSLKVQNLYLYSELIDGLAQQIILAELGLFCEAGLSFENLEKLKNSSSYKSALYFDALKRVH